jgi:hypothetical protein
MTTVATNTTAAAPYGWGTTVGTAPQLVWPGNPSGNGVIFVNNGPTVIAICPALVNLSTTPGTFAGFTAGVPVIGGAGSKNLNAGDVFIIDTLPMTGAWNGISSAAGGVLTIWSF